MRLSWKKFFGNFTKNSRRKKSNNARKAKHFYTRAHVFSKAFVDVLCQENGMLKLISVMFHITQAYKMNEKIFLD